MSLKHELEVWLAALEAFDAREYDAALARFEVRLFSRSAAVLASSADTLASV